MTDLENQPDAWPTRKALVASIVGPMTTILAYHLGAAMLPPELVAAYVSLGAGLAGLIVSLIAAWPVRDRVGDPS